MRRFLVAAALSVASVGLLPGAAQAGLILNCEPEPTPSPPVAGAPGGGILIRCLAEQGGPDQGLPPEPAEPDQGLPPEPETPDQGLPPEPPVPDQELPPEPGEPDTLPAPGGGGGTPMLIAGVVTLSPVTVPAPTG